MGVAGPCTAACVTFLGALFHPAGQRFALIRNAKRAMAWLGAYAKSIGFGSKFKILFSFLGISIVLNSVYDAQLPPEYTTLVENVFGWVKFDVASLLIPTDCVPFPSSSWSSFKTWLLIKGVLPLFVVAIVALVAIVRQCSRLGCTLKNVKLGGLKAVPLALIVLFVFGEPRVTFARATC